MERRRTVNLALIVLAVGGCGIQPTGVVRGGPAVSVPGQEAGVEVCFVRDGELVPVERYDVVLEGGGVAGSEPPLEPDVGDGVPMPAYSRTDLRKIGNLLALGPSVDEQATGLTSEVPAELRLSLFVDSEDRVSVPTDQVGPGSSISAAEGEGEGWQLAVVVGEPADRLSDVAADQVACTLGSYFELIGEAREPALFDVGGNAYP